MTTGASCFVQDRVERVLPTERALILEGGERVAYAASSCIESGVEEPDPAAEGIVLPVKPVHDTARILDRLAICGSLAWRGRLVAALTHRIDRRFMAEYGRVPATARRGVRRRAAGRG